jgi:hypothetical protein
MEIYQKTCKSYSNQIVKIWNTAKMDKHYLWKDKKFQNTFTEIT